MIVNPFNGGMIKKVSAVSPYSFADNGDTRRVAVCNNICTVNVEVRIPTGSHTAGTIMATGFPKPEYAIPIIGFKNGKYFDMYIDNDGSLKILTSKTTTEDMLVIINTAYIFKSLT